MATGPSGHGRPALIRSSIAISSGVYRGKWGLLCGRLTAAALIRRCSRTSAGDVAGFPSGTCGPSQ